MVVKTSYICRQRHVIKSSVILYILSFYHFQLKICDYAQLVYAVWHVQTSFYCFYDAGGCFYLWRHYYPNSFLTLSFLMLSKASWKSVAVTAEKNTRLRTSVLLFIHIFLAFSINAALTHSIRHRRLLWYHA